MALPKVRNKDRPSGRIPGGTHSVEDLTRRFSREGQGKFVYIKEPGDSIRLRFITPPEKWRLFNEHRVQDDEGNWKQVPCRGEDKCAVHEIDPRPKERALIPVWDVKQKRVRWLKVGSNLGKDLLGIFTRGKLLDRDYNLLREGKKLDTRYILDAEEPQKRKVLKEIDPKELNAETVLEDMVNWYYGVKGKDEEMPAKKKKRQDEDEDEDDEDTDTEDEEDDDDDDEDEDEKPSKKKSKAKKSKKKSDDDDDEDEDDDDDDDDEDEDEEDDDEDEKPKKKKAKKKSKSDDDDEDEDEDDEDDDDEDEDEDEEEEKPKKKSKSKKKKSKDDDDDDEEDEDEDEDEEEGEEEEDEDEDEDDDDDKPSKPSKLKSKKKKGKKK